MLQELPFDIGVYLDDSALAARGRYVAANQIRFVRGKAQTRYGNEKFSTSALTGIARGIHAWADTTRAPYLAVGTHLRLYALDQNGISADITPVASYGTLTNPFTTTISTATITVAHTAHGLTDQTLVRFPFLTTTINGASVTATTRYPMTLVDANSYTITADTNATSSGAATTGLTDYEYGLNAGNLDGLAGAGFGTGGYGSGTWGGSNSGLTLYPRTWSFAFWGQNLVANPRGQAIFEWAPNTTTSELVVNAGFTAAASWSANAGWSVGGSVAQASAASATLTQSVAGLSTGAWHLLRVWTTVTNGSFCVTVNALTIQSCSATGHYNQPFWSGVGGTQQVTVVPTVLNGNLTKVSVQVLTTAQRILQYTTAGILGSSPANATSVFSTSERILVSCGGINTISGLQDPMWVAWSGQQNNQLWTAGASNLAGGYPLTNGTRIVRGLPGNGENLIWTDTCLYAMRVVPSPDVVYDFVEIGHGCGLLGPNAAVVVNGIAYWKSPSGQDYFYNGGVPTPISSNTMRRDFNDNLAWVQQDKVFTAPIVAWNEVQHIYPDSRDGTAGPGGGTECSRYNKFQYIDNCWDPGLTTFTCWLDQGVFQFPIAVDTSGYVRYCEKGNSVDGGAFSWSLTSAMVAQGQLGGTASKNLIVNGVQLDAASLQGGYQLSVTSTWKDVRGMHNKTFGPYNANAMSGTISTRAKGEFLQFTWSSTAAAPTFWRAGSDLFDMIPGGEGR